ncbi:MAG: hypothetical protein U5Q44_15415 [Dehalococcoidia bacterium]|nr:hypothetical protein [Dehalococcoidia bacterium]
MTEDYGETGKFFEYDPAEAKALIQAATGEDRVQTMVTANVDRYGAAARQIWEFYAGQMSEAGFDIELNFQEYGSYIQSTYLGDIPEGIGMGPLIGSPRDPNDILSRNLESNSARHNWSGTPIDEMDRIDEMIAEQRTILDTEERIQYIQRHAAGDGRVLAGSSLPRRCRLLLRQPVGPEHALEEQLLRPSLDLRPGLLHGGAHRTGLSKLAGSGASVHRAPPATGSQPRTRAVRNERPDRPLGKYRLVEGPVPCLYVSLRHIVHPNGARSGCAGVPARPVSRRQ